MRTLTGTCRVHVALPADVPDGFKPTWELVNGVVYAYSVVFKGDRGGSFVAGMNDRWPGAMEAEPVRSISMPIRSGLGLKGRIEETKDEQGRAVLTWTSFHSSLGGVYFIRTIGMTWVETRRLVESLQYSVTNDGQLYEWTSDTAEILAATCRGRVALPLVVPRDLHPVRARVNDGTYAFVVDFEGEKGRLVTVSMRDSSGGIIIDSFGPQVTARALPLRSGMDLPGMLVETQSGNRRWVDWFSRAGWPRYYVESVGLSWNEMQTLVSSLRYLPVSADSTVSEGPQK